MLLDTVTRQRQILKFLAARQVLGEKRCKLFDGFKISLNMYEIQHHFVCMHVCVQTAEAAATTDENVGVERDGHGGEKTPVVWANEVSHESLDS